MKIKKHVLVAIVISLGLVLFLGGIKSFQINKEKNERENQKTPPTPVTSFIVEKSTWKNTIKAVGELESTEGAMLSTQSDGRVVKVGFDSGTIVKKGDVLVELDTSVEVAELAGARARLELAKLNLDRQKTLRSKNANSKLDLDNATSEFENARAAVDQIEGVIERRKIIAPFDGTAGIRYINVGQMLMVGTDVVALHALDPLYVNFSLPEQDLARIKIGNVINVSVDPFPKKVFKATLSAIDSFVDSNTRNIRVQGVLKNPKNVLRSGIFARVVVNLGNDREVLAIPSSAISYSPYGNSIFIISKSDGKNPVRTVTSHFIKLGSKKGDLVEVLNGVKDGDEVVSSATFKLHNNAPVIIDNKIQPEALLNPKPVNS